MNRNPPSFSQFISVRYWPTWAGIGLLWLAAWLPLSARLALGALLGRLSYYLARERRYITRVNIGICFPELDAGDREKLVFRSFVENGVGLVETATGWVRNPRRFRHLLKLTGVEHLEAALSRGKGVVLLGAHYTTLDFSAALLSLSHPIGVTYRPHKNALFDAFMLRGRRKICNGVFDRYDLRGAFRHLKQGKILWYAPDQDYGPDHSVFAPLFGHTAATITTANRLARFNDTSTLLVRHHRDDSATPYEIEFIPLPASFPGGDDVEDATVINQYLEQAIRKEPAQYLWMHKRFKTQPGGKPESPYVKIRTPVYTLDEETYTRFIAGAKRVDDITSRRQTLQLGNDMLFRTFPQSPRWQFWRRDPVVMLDRKSKQLRSKGIGSVTVDNIFRVPHLNMAGAVCFPIAARPLEVIPAKERPLRLLANFFARLHENGFRFATINTRRILFDGDDFFITNPETMAVFPTSLCYADRCDNIAMLLKILDAGRPERESFIREYLDTSGLGSVNAFTSMLLPAPAPGREPLSGI